MWVVIRGSKNLKVLYGNGNFELEFYIDFFIFMVLGGRYCCVYIIDKKIKYY